MPAPAHTCEHTLVCAPSPDASSEQPPLGEYTAVPRPLRDELIGLGISKKDTKTCPFQARNMDSYTCLICSHHTSKCSQKMTCSLSSFICYNLSLCWLPETCKLSQFLQFCIEKSTIFCFHSNQCLDMSHFGLEHCHI